MQKPYTTVNDVIRALQQYPPNTPVIGVVNGTSSNMFSIQGCTGIDPAKPNNVMICCWKNDEGGIPLGYIEPTGIIDIPKPLCDYDTF